MTFKKLFLFLIILLPTTTFAKLQVLTTTTDLAWLAKEIVKDKADVKSLLQGTEDPHFVEARPDYILKAARADILCSIGLELEIGWLPKVLEKSGNAKIQSGGSGFCETGTNVQAIDKPVKALDRSMGDVHPFGNPHFWMSPTALANAAEVITASLEKVDSSNASFYKKNAADISEKLATLENETKKRFVEKNLVVIEYHKEFAYLLHVYNLNSVGSIEETPGVAPSASRLGHIIQEIKTKKVRLILASTNNNKSILEKVSVASGVKLLLLPSILKKDANYIEQHKQIIDSILDSLK